ncbi:MAG: HlyD family secretion protein [Novosphingobium sp.]|uniref:HlyD family secretion protein n=1 Tax=Novosphingobium sp. TaxID=1874826 RepID=UPI0032B74FDC
MAEADPALPREADSAAATAAPPLRRRWARLALMLSVPLLLIIGGVLYWQSLQGQVSTDNAYVHLDKVSVSGEVGGKIVEVAVKENQHVKAGDLLFRIDPEPFQLQIAQADAAMASAQASQVALANVSALSGAEVSAAQESIAYARSNLTRQQALWKRGFTTKASFEAAQHTVAMAQEQLRLAESKSREAAAKLATGTQVPGVFPQVAAARAQRALAELNLRRSEVRAPAAGQIAQADRLQAGQELVSGLPVLTIVADATGYVEANFKETDLAEMKVGQAAEVRFDAYPGVKLKGHVAAIGAGTGSEFSVLPAQNATGNWVKVTQRVPVRIALDEPSPRQLIAGLSTKVKVFTADSRR